MTDKVVELGDARECKKVLAWFDAVYAGKEPPKLTEREENLAARYEMYMMGATDQSPWIDE